MLTQLYCCCSNPVVCGIASLGLDHVELLGDTLEKIAWQKGGICKPGRPALTVPQEEGPLRVLQERAAELQVRAATSEGGGPTDYITMLTS